MIAKLLKDKMFPFNALTSSLCMLHSVSSDVECVDINQKSIDEMISILEKRTSSLDLHEKTKVTPFRLRVWALCSCIPLGRVTTYKSISDALSIGSSQAVGQALRNNPFSPFVPCHRVVNARGDLHGFSGSASTEALGRKHSQLSEENVQFEGPLRVSKCSMCVLKIKRV